MKLGPPQKGSRQRDVVAKISQERQLPFRCLPAEPPDDSMPSLGFFWLRSGYMLASRPT